MAINNNALIESLSKLNKYKSNQVVDPRNTSPAVNNPATNNLATNNYIEYKWKADRNKVRNAYGTMPEFDNSLQRELTSIKEYMFDYNDPNQVNSIADVIFNTATNMGRSFQGIDPWMSTLKNAASDSHTLIMSGIFKPIMHRNIDGDWDPQWAVLFNNQLVNLGETADLVDGLWKSYAIGSGFMDFKFDEDGSWDWRGDKIFNHDDGVEGLKDYVFNRKNFDFETGNRIIDWFWEMMSPTNLMSWGLGATSKSVAKEAAGELGVSASKKTLNAFAKTYTGDLDKALAKMPRLLPGAEVDLLKKIATDSTNMRVLTSLNRARGVVDFIDSLGPKLAIKSTVGIPWKIIKTASGASSKIVQYMANEVGKVSPTQPKTLVSVLSSRPDYEYAIKTVTEAAELTGNKAPVGVLDAVVSKAANGEAQSLRNLYVKFKKLKYSEKQVTDFAQEHFKQTGRLFDLETATEALRLQDYSHFIKSLDEFASEVSGGLYKSFDEYAALVSRMYNVTDMGQAVKNLHTLTESLRMEVRMGTILTTQKELSELYKLVVEGIGDAVNNTKGIYFDGNERLAATMHEELRTLSIYAGPGHKTTMVNRRNTLANSLKEIERLENLRGKEYSQAKKQGLKYNASKIDAEINRLYDVVGDSTKKDVTKLDKYIKSLDDLPNKIARMQKDFDEFDYNKVRLETLGVFAEETVPRIEVDNYIDILQEFADKMQLMYEQSPDELGGSIFKTYRDNIINAIEKINHTVMLANTDAANIKNIDDIGKGVMDVLLDQSKTIAGLADNMVADYTVNANLQKLTQLIYGKDEMKVLDDIVNSMEVKLKDTNLTVLEQQLRDTFYDSGLLKATEYEQFLKQLDDITVSLRVELPLLGDTATSYELMERYHNVVRTLNENIEQLQEGYNNHKVVNSKLVEEIYNDASDIKYQLTRALEFAEDATDIQQALDTIDLIEDSLGLTADIIMEYGKEVTKVYNPKINATFRNLHLLKTTDLSDLLQGLVFKDYETYPALEVIEALSEYSTSKITTVISEVNRITKALEVIYSETPGMTKGPYTMSELGKIVDLKLLSDSYFEITGMRIDNAAITLDELSKSINLVSEASQSASIIMDTLHGMVSVQKLYGSILHATETGLDKSVATHLLDAIQRQYNSPATLVDPIKLKANPSLLTKAVDDIVDNIEMQLRGSTLKHNIKLQGWRDRIVELYKQGKISSEAMNEYTELFGDPAKSLTAHTAIADAYSEYLIHRHVLKNDTTPGIKYVYMDIEASGLADTSIIYQQSVIIPETGVRKWYINGSVPEGHNPTDTRLLHTLFGDENMTMDTIELRKKFDMIYRSGDATLAEKTLREHFNLKSADIEIIMTKGEAELLSQAKAFVDTQAPPRGKMVYRLHNGLEYDIPLMNTRARVLGLTDYRINHNRVEDTKVMLEEMLNLRTLTVQERKTIEDIILDHIGNRMAEPAMLSMYRGLGGANLTPRLMSDTGKFLPTMDSRFKDALDNLSKTFDPETMEGNIFSDSNLYEDSVSVFQELYDTFKSTREQLVHLGNLDKRLKRLSLVVDSESAAKGHRLIPEDFFKNIPKDLQANHVGLDLMHVNLIDGVYAPVMGVKTVYDTSLIENYFDVQGKPLTRSTAERMTQLAKNITQKTMYLKNDELINSVPLSDLQELQTLMVTELEKMAGTTYFSQAVRDLKMHDNIVTQWATVLELYSTFESMGKGVFKNVEFESSPGNKWWRYDYMIDLELKHPHLEEAMRLMEKPSDMFSRTLKDYGEDMKFFELDHDLEYYRRGSDIAFKNISELVEATDKVETTRMKRMLPIYRHMTDSFDSFRDVATEVLTRIEEEYKDNPKMKPNISDSNIYRYLRVASENYDAPIAYRKIETFLSLPPNEMASYIYNHAKGVVTFRNTDLASESYFPLRNGVKSEDFINANMYKRITDILDNPQALKDAGVSVHYDRFTTTFYIDKTDISKFKNIEYKPILEDFGADDALDLMLNSALAKDDEVAKYINMYGMDKAKKALQDLDKSRRHLVDLAPDAGTSTLEVLDEIAMDNLVKGLPTEVQKNMLPLHEMQRLGFFEGNFFNHSVLGHIDSRRILMPYSAFNPAKTMFHAADLVESKLGVQMQLTQLLQTPEFMVKNILQSSDSPEEFISHLKQSPHLKVAFFNGKTKGTTKDFNLASININSVKDLEFAKKVGAVLIDVNTYNTAYSVINNYKITNSALKFFNRLIFTPMKLGWLGYNMGVVFRNTLDTAKKNISATKDLAIISTMAETVKDYWNYKNIIGEIYEYATKQNIKPEVAVEEFFAKGKARMSRETFDMLAEYQKVNGSMSMFKEVQKYYGDAMDKMYQRAGAEKAGMSDVEFKEFMRMPDDVALEYLKGKLGTTADDLLIANVMGVKSDLIVYKRAYSMHEMYTNGKGIKGVRGRDITVEQFVTYLKSGKIPPEHTEVFEDLYKKTKHVLVDDDLITKVMNSPVVANSMNANMHVEEILRMSLYKYLREQGLSTPKSIAEVTRVHYDYSHRSLAQLYIEMFFPFSTFKTLSTQYWAEEFLDSPLAAEVMIDTWKTSTQFTERERDDYLLRRSLQYQIMSGNVILNQDNGLTLKVNPSEIDAMQFFISPVAYVMGSFHSGGQAVWNLMTMEPYDKEPEEDFLFRKKTQALSLIPFFGTHVNRMRQAEKNEDNPVAALIFGPVFNTTWTPEQRDKEYVPYEERPYMPSLSYWNSKSYAQRQRSGYRGYPRRSWGRKQYLRKNYPKKVYPKNLHKHTKHPRTFYGYKDWSNYSLQMRYSRDAYKFRGNRVHATKDSRSVNRVFSDIWRRSMSKKGNAKYKFLSFPTNKWTLQLKINILRNITSHMRWQ